MRRRLGRLLVLVALALASASANAVVTLTATPASVAPGGTLTATWSGIPSPSAINWIGLYTPGAAHGAFITRIFTNGAASGSLPFPIPTSVAAGTYQLRLFASNIGSLLATSNNFTVSITVSGTVTLGGSPLAGVTFAATNGGTCTPSNASGQYICAIPQNWSGTVTPSLSGYFFTPESRSYSNVTATQTAQNYTAVVAVQVSGRVTAVGSSLPGVAFAASSPGFCSASDASGAYSCSVPQGWSGSVTPTLAPYAFTPASRSYSNVTANQPGQDYVTDTVQVSGTVAVGALPLGGVIVAATNFGSCTSTNTSGQYSCTVPQGWSGTVTPSLANYSFTPPSRSHTTVASNLPGQDFGAAAAGGAASIYYIHADHLNTPRLITNQTVQAVWRWDQQEPFGVNAANEDPSGLGAFEFALRFPGQYADKETNLNYNYFRDCYDPAIGRFCQSDPIGLRGGTNTFLYVGASPTNFVDPDGLLTCWYEIFSRALRCSNNAGQTMVTSATISGTGECENNPSCADQPFKGPIPQGVYTIRPPGWISKRPRWLYLDPSSSNQMQGRNQFFFHPQGTISQGCIALRPSDMRTIIDWAKQDGGGSLGVTD